MKKEAENCWDYWKCEKKTRKNCPAHTTDSGRECWMVANSFKDKCCPKVKKSFKNCFECKWFNKLNPNF